MALTCAAEELFGLRALGGWRSFAAGRAVPRIPWRAPGSKTGTGRSAAALLARCSAARGTAPVATRGWPRSSMASGPGLGDGQGGRVAGAVVNAVGVGVGVECAGR